MNILVTGGTRGLGLEIVRHQLALNNSVFVISRSISSDLEALLADNPQRLTFLAFDLSDVAAIKEQVFDILFGTQIPLHGLVNNAAVAYDDLASNLNLAELEAMFRINVYAPMQLTKCAIRNMLLHQTAGSIVHISSICAHAGYKGLAMYASTKGALEAYSKNVAREWGSRRIRSNCVVPGFMETDMSSALSNEQRQRITKRTALGQPTATGSVASIVDYLLSDASESVTGQDFIVDAGTL